MSLPLQQGSAPQHFAWFHWIGHPRKPHGRCKHLRSIWHTSRLRGDFVQLQILGSKFWGLGGLNRKSNKKQFCRVPHGELTAKKRLDSIDKQKRRSNLKEHCDRQIDKQTETQTESTTKNKTPSLGADINKVLATLFHWKSCSNYRHVTRSVDESCGRGDTVTELAVRYPWLAAFTTRTRPQYRNVRSKISSHFNRRNLRQMIDDSGENNYSVKPCSVVRGLRTP